MNRYFIDLGANKGDGIKWCRNYYSINGLNYMVYAFEPVPALFHNLKRKYKSRVLCYKSAAWTEVGRKRLNLSGNDLSSSFYNHIGDSHIVVDTFDFSSWLRAHFSGDDYIVVKMNIEGAEFPILSKMIADDTIELVDDLYCQFHPNIEPKPEKGLQESILKTIKARGVRYQPWINGSTTKRII